MKERIQRISQSTYKLIQWSLKHRWQSFAVVSLVILLGVLVRYIITPKLQETTISLNDEGTASEIIEEIELVNNLGLPNDEILIVDDTSNSLQMWFDPANSNIRLHNTDTDTSWNTTFNSSRDFDTLETYEIEAMNMLNITYFGYDNSSAKWNVFEYSVMSGNYQANTIENGVQLVFDVRDLNSVNLFEYIPQEISRERYNSIFIEGIEEADIPASDKVNLQSTFDYCYRYREETDSYYYRLATTPQLAMIDYLIYATELFNYTQEDVIEDNAEFGIDTVFIERPSFVVTMEFIIEDGDFVVKVPTNAITNGSDKFEIINIEVLPNLGGADYRYKEGFTFVPDGAGAIMDLDSYQSAYPRYRKPVYDNNLYFDIYNENEYSESIEMPVFGMTYKSGLSRPMQGFLGIIEQGQEYAYIQSQVSDGYSMNQSFSSFDTIQDTYLKVFGPYAIQNNLFRSASPFSNFTYQVRYKLLDESESTYYEMSQIYQEYLIEQYNLQQKMSNAVVHLDVLGALVVQKRMFGIPYDSVQTYTTTSQLASMIDTIGVETSVNYMGALNRGVKNDLMNRVNVVRKIEDGTSLQELLDLYSNIYIGTNLTRSYNEKNGMRDRYAIHDFYGEPLGISQYNIATGQFEEDIITNDYQVVSPRYLSSLVDQYLTQSEWLNNVAIFDMGNTYYVDYNRNHYVSGKDAFNLLHQQFDKINAKQSIMLSSPFIEFIPYIDMATNISRESSHYGGFTETIPFKQLVLSGLIPFTTSSINHDTSLVDRYFLLQYAEFGAIPSFMVSHDDTINLKETEYSNYYSLQFEFHQQAIENAIDYMEQIDVNKTGQTIINHTIVGQRIYHITFDDNSSLYVNYNDYSVTVTLDETTSISIDPYGYLWE